MQVKTKKKSSVETSIKIGLIVYLIDCLIDCLLVYLFAHSFLTAVTSVFYQVEKSNLSFFSLKSAQTFSVL